jgi:hypothetical protein
MRIVKYVPLCLVPSLVGCLEGKRPVEKLSFDELQRVAEDCQRTGKVATDDYCKEASHVFAWKDREKREQDRLAKVRKETYPTKGFGD